MGLRIPLLATVALAAAAFVSAAVVQDKKPDPAGGPPMDMPATQAGPEHALLKKMAGTWDTTVKFMIPGMPPDISKGSETSRMLGDLWLVSDFEGTAMGGPFKGHGIMGYDPAKKKYVGVWVDTMTSHPQLSEGTYDAGTRTMTMTAKGMDMATGQPVDQRHVSRFIDDDTAVFEMFQGGAKEPILTIEY
ncbi:MAG TPA: DUF1579 domain-containing protein, partial [Planctomycetota bacterium]|nr:DUF1579 domain-containing protein [Planctomycetota bacterium]